MKHVLSTRLWHWTNAVAVVVMIMSGAMISNAHPMLYWGDYGANFDHAWLQLPRFPGWMTIPSEYSLAVARIWHLAFAWVFAFGLAAYMVASLLNRHFARDMTVRAAHLRAIPGDIRDHLKGHFAPDNVLQRLSYVVVLFGLLPLLIWTGMLLQPGLYNALPDPFGGRASVRSLHFIAATLTTLFLGGHVGAVLIGGPWRLMRAMIVGK